MDAQLASLSISLHERRRRRRRQPPQSTRGQVSALRHHNCHIRAGVHRLLVTVCEPPSACWSAVDPRRRRHRLVDAGLPEGHVDNDGISVSGQSTSTSDELQQLVHNLSDTHMGRIQRRMRRCMMHPYPCIPASVCVASRLIFPHTQTLTCKTDCQVSTSVQLSGGGTAPEPPTRGSALDPRHHPPQTTSASARGRIICMSYRRVSYYQSVWLVLIGLSVFVTDLRSLHLQSNRYKYSH